MCPSISEPSSSAPQGPQLALVLAGGAARGAYEVGVLDYLLRQVMVDLDPEARARLRILCGTSVGALNACMLAAWIDRLQTAADEMVRYWCGLRIGNVLHFEPGALRRLFGGSIGFPSSLSSALFSSSGNEGAWPGRRGGLVNATGLAHFLRMAVPFRRIHENIQAGHLSALAVSATAVATGQSVLFIDRTGGGLPPWGKDRHCIARPTHIHLAHAMASAAIPLLFPPVRIGGLDYCDGGLRLNVPLSPARKLGADRLLIVSPRYLPDHETSDVGQVNVVNVPTFGENGGGHTAPVSPSLQAVGKAKEPAIPRPLFLLGKALSALMLDRLDSDIDRLERINAILRAGERVYGPNFVAEINREMSRSGGKVSALRPLETLMIRTTTNIATIAAEFVASPTFSKRAPRAIAWLLRRLGESDARGEADLLSYLLFDGEFSGRLIELGRADAKVHHEALCQLFTRPG